MKVIIAILLSLFALSAGADKFQAPYQKPGAAVQLLAPDSLNFMPGESRHFVGVFETAKTSGEMRVRLQYDEALQVSAAAKEYVFDLAKGKPEIAFELSATREGRYQIDFQIELDGRTRNLSRSVYVGDKQKLRAEKQQRTPKTLIELPAQESLPSRKKSEQK